MTCLFPLINLCLVVTLFARDVGIRSLTSWRTEQMRQRVIALIERGFSVSEVGRMCHVPLRTAQRWAHKFQNYGEFQRRYSTGRPRCSTREEDEAVRRVHEENPFRSAKQIRVAANFTGTFRTVMSRLRDGNIHCRRAAP